MLRRKMLKVLGLLTFGLFIPKGAKGAAVEASPEREAFDVLVRYGGNVGNLGFLINRDTHLNTLRMDSLRRSVTMRLWALGVIDPPEGLRASGIPEGMGGHVEKARLMHEDILANLRASALGGMRSYAATDDEPDATVGRIYHQGKLFELGMTLFNRDARDRELNAKRLRALLNGHEEALWALGLIETPDRIRESKIFPDSELATQEEKLEWLRAIDRKRMGIPS